MQRLRTATAIALILALSACGGGGGEVNSAASVPGPTAGGAPGLATQRIPLPPTPATTSGTYAGISTFTSISFDGSGQVQTVVPVQMALEGAINLTVDASTRTYTLTVTAGAYQFPAGLMTMPADSDLGYTRSFPLTNGTSPDFFSPQAQKARGDLVTQAVAAGTGESGAIRALVSWVRLFNVGHMAGMPRYLSTAHWGQFYTENASGLPGAENFKPTQETMGTMVFGQRTEPGDIPVTGTARYVLESLSGGFVHPAPDENGDIYNPDGTTVLDVDFATRRMDATYEQTNAGLLYDYDSEGTAIDINGDDIEDTFATAIHASGSTIVENSGSFAVPLTGTGSVHVALSGQPTTNISTPVAGSLTGAFFGPQAAEVGGIWNLPYFTGLDGTTATLSGDFAGIREAP